MCTCLLGIQFDVQRSSPICVDLIVILASTTVLFLSSVEVLGAKHSRSPKVWNEFDYSSPGRDPLMNFFSCPYVRATGMQMDDFHPLLNVIISANKMIFFWTSIPLPKLFYPTRLLLYAAENN